MQRMSFLKYTLSLAVCGVLAGMLGAVAVHADVDTTPPVIGALTPTTVTAGQSNDFSVSYTDNSSGINYCYFAVDGSGSIMVQGSGSNGNVGTMHLPYTFSAGSHSVTVTCYDNAGNQRISSPTVVTASVVTPSPSGDYVAPVVENISTFTATTNQTTRYEARYSDNVGVTRCLFYVDGTYIGDGTLGAAAAGTVYYNYARGPAGRYLMHFECVDAALNRGAGTNSAVTISDAPVTDSSAPTVGSIATPSTGTGMPVTFSTAYSDNVGVTGCTFYRDGTAAGPVTLSGTLSGTASYTTSFNTAGSHLVSFTCYDAAGNSRNTGDYTEIVTGATVGGGDSSAPTVGSIATPSTGTGMPITFSTSYSDNVGVTGCTFYRDGTAAGPVTLSGTLSGTASYTTFFNTAGSHLVSFTCYDAAGNSRNTGDYTEVVTGATLGGADVTNPTVGVLSPAYAYTGAAVTLSAAVSDDVGVANCRLYVNGTLAWTSGAMGGIRSGTTSVTYSFNSAGSYRARFECTDISGNIGVGPDVFVSVTGNNPSSNTVSVGQVGPLSVVANNNTNFTAWVSNTGYNVANCQLMVNGANYGEMSISGNTASRYYNFTSPGTYSIYARCWDRLGNVVNGQTSTLQVNSQSYYPYPGSTPGATTMGNLMKAACPGYYVDSDHPCRAVYYFGRDGRRHAFPNANVYFTWYTDFSRVVEVSDSFLASIPLGRNVTYRPGVRLVKFTTVNRVYAVGRGGVLHWLASEDVARQLYGYSWATQVDDIADVFYTNYTFGSDVYSASQFNVATEAGLAPTIDDNF